MAAIHVNVDSLRKVRPARRDSINNGADDDGSGSMAVLEIAQAMVAMKPHPKRSILFVWHTGEELGLLGSRWYTDHTTVPRDSIVAQLNIDMIGRGAAIDIKNGGPLYLQLIGSSRLSTELGQLIEAKNKARKQPFIFDYTFDANGHPENIYCRSDHANYARYGIPITFFTTGTPPGLPPAHRRAAVHRLPALRAGDAVHLRRRRDRREPRSSRRGGPPQARPGRRLPAVARQ